MMRYLPALVSAIGICVATSVGLYFTKDSACLLGFFFLLLVYRMIPFKNDER